MKILLLGKNGQVGWELNRALMSLGCVVALDRNGADFSSPEGLRNIVSTENPDVIINAVAYTAVDKAEGEERLAEIINAVAPGVLAEEALKINALLVHYSTDYVFDGNKKTPYGEIDEPNPINIYGRTKLLGEQAIQSSGCNYLIFRTSWVYASRGKNFLLSILKLAQEREELGIVSDQVGSPTSARLIAETTSLCINTVMKEMSSTASSSAVYHLTSSGNTSWYGFAEEIISFVSEAPSLSLKIKNLKAIATSEYPTAAKRPMNSQLMSNKLESEFGLIMPEWRNALILCMEEL